MRPSQETWPRHSTARPAQIHHQQRCHPFNTRHRSSGHNRPVHFTTRTVHSADLACSQFAVRSAHRHCEREGRSTPGAHDARLLEAGWKTTMCACIHMQLQRVAPLFGGGPDASTSAAARHAPGTSGHQTRATTCMHCITHVCYKLHRGSTRRRPGLH